MARRRLFRRSASPTMPSSPSSRRAIRAAGYGIESLENRLLFHTIGYDPATRTLVPDGAFEYYDEKKNTVRVVWHDVVAELIGVSVDPMTDATAESELVSPSTPEPTDGVNLFTIYITQSSADSYISIAQVPSIDTKGARNMEPFNSDVGALSVIDPTGTNPRTTFTPSAGSGVVLLGATYFGPTGSAFSPNEPFVTVPSQPLGVYPGVYPGLDPTTLIAGLVSTPTQMDPTTGTPVVDATTGLQTPNDLGRFFFGGTILGSISIPAAPVGSVPAAPASQGGNVGVFYAGCILTGANPDGFNQGIGSASDQVSNFTVAGDIRDLVTNGPIGGGPLGMNNYLSGTYIVVGGTVGEINVLQGNFFATYDVEHGASVFGLPESLFPETELEVKGPNAGVIFQGNAIDPLTGLVDYPGLTVFTNDTTATPQFLGSQQITDPISDLPVRDQNGNLEYEGFVSGVIQGSLAPALRETGSDYYAVALMAGQTITVIPSTGGEAQTQIIDPDGRIVASDNRIIDEPFQYTADRPGIYDIGVLDPTGILDLFDIPYTLEVQGVGDMGLAAVAVRNGSIFDGGFDTGFEVDNGDLGAMDAAANIKSITSGPDLPVGALINTLAPRSLLVSNGDLRALVAAVLGAVVSPGGLDAGTGLTVAPAFGDPVIIDVPLGSVGLLRATDATDVGVLDVETTFNPTLLTSLTPLSPIGGSIQRIDGSATTFLEIAANGGIGTIDAGSMNTLTPSFIEVNADNKGSDGIIDMIDCQGQFGVLGGGPEFITNQGGDIRYLRAGGAVFKDEFFGGTQIIPQQFDPGKPVTITDDSGSQVTFTPVGVVAVVTVVNADGTTTTTTTGPQVTLMTYPIRDKGGQVTMTVACTGSLTISGSGLSGANSAAEIGSVSITGVGRALVTGADDIHGNVTFSQPIPPAVAGVVDTTDLELNINGGISVDVLNVAVATTVAGNEAVAINNNSPGELVGITGVGAATIFSRGNLGLATPRSTATAVLPVEPLLTGYPFNQQTTGINITGSVVTMSSNAAIGNVVVVGDIQTLIADADGKDVPGVYAGIDGNVVVNAVANIGGRLLNVSIGQGILPSGTGDLSQAGLYVGGTIGFVTGNGSIRGNIISLEAGNIPAEPAGTTVAAAGPLDVGIQGISIGGSGSIIGAFIGTAVAFADVDLVNGGLAIPGFATRPAGLLTFDLGPVSVTGNGGIIGTAFFAGSLGLISVGPKGFGVLSSTLETVANGNMAGISAGGYGIRDDLITGGNNVGTLNAYGNGAQESVLKFPKELLVSNTPDEFDPFFKTLPTSLTDLNAILGTSLVAPIISSITQTGVIEDTEAQGLGTLGSVSAHLIRTTLPLFNVGLAPVESPFLNVPMIGNTFLMSLSFGSGVGNVFVATTVDGLAITAGSLGDFRPGQGVSRLGISVAGLIRSITIHGNLGQTVTDPNTGALVPDSFVNATGPDGSIGSLRVSGSVSANVTSNSTLGSITVGGNVIGTISALGQTSGLALKSIRIGGALQNGSLIIDGSAGSIFTNGGLGSTGDSLTVAGNLGSLLVGATKGAGHNLNSAVHIMGSLGKLTVYGQINAAVTVDSDLGSMKVFAQGPVDNEINGAITIGSRLGSATIADGSINANFIVNGSINSFNLIRGSVAVGATVESNIETIRSFRITGGDAFGLYGTLLAANGLNEKIDISGNVGDGVHAASITAASGAVFRVRGTIRTLSSILVSSTLGLLDVNGNIEAGASVTAHPLVKITVDGTNQGTIVRI